MKKTVSLLIATLIMLSTLCGCNLRYDSIQVNADEKILNEFSYVLSADQVMTDLEDVDKYLVMDTTNLTAKETKDEENDTATIDYKNANGELVYTDYIGYGEDSFAYYTTSLSGKDLTVMYVDQNKKRYSVLASCDEYSADFSELNEKNEYGANQINITVNKDGTDLPVFITYSYMDAKWTASAQYFEDDGYHRYSSEIYDGKTEDYNDIIMAKLKTKPTLEAATVKMLGDKLIKSIDFLFGQTKITYTQDDDGTRHFFMTEDYILEFKNSDDAEAFAEKYSLKAEPFEYDREKIIVKTGEISLPFASDYEGIDDFASIDGDSYYTSVTLNKDGEIEKTSRGNSTISYG